MNDSIYNFDEVEMGLMRAIHESQNGLYGLKTIVFPDLPQRVVDELEDMICDAIERELGIRVEIDG